PRAVVHRPARHQPRGDRVLAPRDPCALRRSRPCRRTRGADVHHRTPGARLMHWLRALDEGFRNRLLAQDTEACRSWLDSLSDICVEVARHWQLIQAGPPSYGGAGIVLPVTMPGDRPAALK